MMNISEHDVHDHVDIHGLDLHQECKNQCRSSIILQYIELYPDSLAKADEEKYLPLHRLLENKLSSIDVALTMIEKYPYPPPTPILALDSRTNSRSNQRGN
jgi:hypothetical protein